MMEDHQSLTSPVKEERRTPEICPSLLLPQDGSEQHHNVPQDDQLVNSGEDLNIIYVTETHEMDDEQSIEDIPTDNHPDDCTRSSEEHLISSDFKADDCGIKEDTYEALHTKKKSESFKQVVSPGSSQTVKQNKRYRGFVEHQNAHARETPLSCSECRNCFSHKSDLVIHQRSGARKRTVCLECGKSFNQKSALVVHQRTHTGEKPYSCSECGKHFTQKTGLIRHRVTHTGEKPFLCPECGKYFTQKSNLVIHQKAHTGEKPYSCPECGKFFNKKSVLITHQKIHTGEKPFSCPECEKRFPDKTHLFKHLKTHTREKPFSCPKCWKCYSQKSDLVKHQRSHKGEKPF
ncbi:zinc finger protein OZF-like [Bufo gargarizans]|uniref:zinc finger protein OZF-like n=1 Tax=Bufo gargarizans TaxID=30331 RepID=UPI001CF1C3CA|nr:zinc finger protein OZF-like [Bufo gargarizans]